MQKGLSRLYRLTLKKRGFYVYPIVKKQRLNDTVTLMEIYAPLVAAKYQAGQFIILRLDELGERIPLTICYTDKEKGTIAIIFQPVGFTTKTLNTLEEGDSLLDVVGPLGAPSELEGIKKAVVVGGGVGCAIAYPIAKALHDAGAEVHMIAGFRNKDIVILEDKMRDASTKLYMCTDDGSYGEKGFVTNKLQSLLDADNTYDVVYALGPVIMMKFCCATSKPYGVKTVISLNPIMVDGTGMCGCCRVTIGGETKFACVDGPEFDGHQVDYDELMKRNSFYNEFEKESAAHICNLTGGIRHNG